MSHPVGLTPRHRQRKSRIRLGRRPFGVDQEGRQALQDILSSKLCMISHLWWHLLAFAVLFRSIWHGCGRALLRGALLRAWNSWLQDESGDGTAIATWLDQLGLVAFKV